MLKKISQWLKAAADVALPRVCPVCGKALDADEQWLCRKCLAGLTRTRYENTPFNAMEQLFAGKVPVERATSYFFYEKGVTDMAASGFFDGIDLVTAVPLHRSKLAHRGYNQSEHLAHGIADALHIPYVEALKAVRPHATQTHKGALERWQNIQGNYALNPKKADLLAGKHVLLVDDVVTTGSTLTVCATELLKIPEVKVSIFTLAAAKLE